MLPGFNHNIRYKDRVFHVQTEDNGLGQPRIVTQVFIEGHILAVEKSSYQEILDTTQDQTERTTMIRNKMQDQHRRLLKSLVQGAHDERIGLYLEGPRSGPQTPALVAPTPLGAAKVPPPVPDAVFRAAEDIPEAPAALADGEDVEPWRPLLPEDLIEIEDPVEEGADTLRPALRGDPTPNRLADDLEAPPVSSPRNAPLPPPDSEFLSVLDAEMQRQLPWASSDEIMASPPPLRLDSNPGQEGGPRPSTPPQAKPNFRDARRGAKVLPAGGGPGLRPPPASDTLVDFGLPASLREQLAANLEARRKADAQRPFAESGPPDPRASRFRLSAPAGSDDLPSARPSALESAAERRTVLDMELRRAAAETTAPPARGPIPTGGGDTILEIDARELHRKVAEQRSRLRGSREEAVTEDQALPHTEPRPAEPLKRPESKPPRAPRSPPSGVRVTPIIQGEAVSARAEEEASPKSILVVERSLDEVILSYLSDDQE